MADEHASLAQDRVGGVIWQTSFSTLGRAARKRTRANHVRGIEFYNRVKSADPSTAAFLVVLLASSGLESDATLKDKASLSALVSGTTDEATNTGYARKVLVAADIAALPSPDNTNDWWQVTIPNQTWSAVSNDGTGAIGKLVICYRPATGSADSAVIPLTAHDFSVTPNGGSIATVVDSNGFYRAGE